MSPYLPRPNHPSTGTFPQRTLPCLASHPSTSSRLQLQAAKRTLEQPTNTTRYRPVHHRRAMPAVTAPRPASTTPRSTPVKTAPSKGGAGSNGGTTTTTNGRTRPRSAVPPMTAPPKMVRAASASSSSLSQFAPNNRDWQLDRIRRLLYEQVIDTSNTHTPRPPVRTPRPPIDNSDDSDRLSPNKHPQTRTQECVELKGQLQEKEAEIETIRQEKTRITLVRRMDVNHVNHALSRLRPPRWYRTPCDPSISISHSLFTLHTGLLGGPGPGHLPAGDPDREAGAAGAGPQRPGEEDFVLLLVLRLSPPVRDVWCVFI